MSFTRPYLIDTTVLIDVSRGRQPALSWLEESIIHPGQVCVSTVSISEFFAGVRPVQREDWRVFIARLTQWQVTTEIAILAGVLRFDLARQGRALQIAFASDCGPHWAPPAFVAWEGYATLWQNIAGWVAGSRGR